MCVTEQNTTQPKGTKLPRGNKKRTVERGAVSFLRSVVAPEPRLPAFCVLFPLVCLSACCEPPPCHHVVGASGVPGLHQARGSGLKPKRCVVCVCVCVGLCRSGCFNSLLFAVAAAVPLRPPRVPVRVVSKGAGDDAAAVDITWFCLCGASLTSLSSLISSRLTHLHLA